MTEPKTPVERAAQGTLEESEDRYRDLVGTHDLSGRILSINRAGRESVGVDEQTLLKGSLRDFLAPEFRGLFDGYLATLRKEGRASAARQLHLVTTISVSSDRTTCQSVGALGRLPTGTASPSWGGRRALRTHCAEGRRDGSGQICPAPGLRITASVRTYSSASRRNR